MNTLKHGFVYIWFDRKHKRYYIGAHWGKEDDGYICSSNWMRDAYRRRPQDFKRRIIITNILSRKETFSVESHWLSLIKKDEIGKRYYNLHNDPRNLNHWSGCEESAKSMVEKRKATIAKKPEIWEAVRVNHSNFMKAKWTDEEFRQRQTNSHKLSSTRMWADVEHKKRHCEAAKKAWDKRTRCTLTVEEKRRRHNEYDLRSRRKRGVLSKKNRWKDPVYRLHMSEVHKKVVDTL